jgi:hypothetical protein
MNRIVDYIAVRVTEGDRCLVMHVDNFDFTKAKSACYVCHGTGTAGWIRCTVDKKPAMVRLLCRNCGAKMIKKQEIAKVPFLKLPRERNRSGIFNIFRRLFRAVRSISKIFPRRKE